MSCQRGADALFDLDDLHGRVLQFIDPVHENDDVTRLEVRDQADEAYIR